MARLTLLIYSYVHVVLYTFCATLDPGTQNCNKYTNIHVRNDDGLEHILTIRASESQCGDGDPLLPNTRYANYNSDSTPEENRPQQDKKSRTLLHSTGGDGLPYSPNRIPKVPFHTGAKSIDISPTITVFISDVISTICNNPFIDEPTICQGFRNLASGCPLEGNSNREIVDQYASYIVENKLLPVPTGDYNADLKVAYGLVLLGAELVDESVEYFTHLIRQYPNLASAYHGRGMAYARKGLVPQLTQHAIADFTKASEMEPNNPDHLHRKAELCIPLGRYNEALESITKALTLETYSTRSYFLKATLEFMSEDLKAAETDFRNAIDFVGQPYTLHTYYNLALTLYHRGMYRNSIEVFKDLVRKSPSHIDGQASLAHVYSQLGDEKNAYKAFNASLQLSREHLLTRQLKGAFHYNMGEVTPALKEFKKCINLDKNNLPCQYMEAVTLTAMGKFYQGIKSLTKVIVHKQQTIQMSPEFIKAHYLREYGRYIHQNLDEPISELDFDSDFSPQFKDKWTRNDPLIFKTHNDEQPGLSPFIDDVETPPLLEQPLEIRELLCYARHVGSLMGYPTDGYLSNYRESLLMGLASIHIAQNMQEIWKNFSRGRIDQTAISWREVFNIAIKYRQLLNPEEPVLWLDQFPEEQISQGYTHDMYIVRGHTVNVRLMHYFDLVYKLINTMVSLHCGEDKMYPEAVMHEFQSVETYDEMIEVFKKDMFRDKGYVMSTQLPSIKDPDSPKHEGVFLSIAADNQGKVALSVNLPYNRAKAEAIHLELEYVFYELFSEVKKLDGGTLDNSDPVMNLILSLIYYFLNLSPLSHGSGAVAWSVALGLIMSMGYEVTGKIASGKILDIEAVLSGGPEVFSKVTKDWSKIRKMVKNQLGMLPRVTDALPTLREVLEVASYARPQCYDIYQISKTFL